MFEQKTMIGSKSHEYGLSSGLVEGSGSPDQFFSSDSDLISKAESS